MAGTAWASLSPGVASPPGTDVWLHGFAYGLFTLLLYSALRRRHSPAHPLLAGVLAWGYGLILEGAQALTPYRAAEARDLIANAIGCAAAVVLAVAVRQ
jgi:VanZ family protein